jgi:putative glutamine amidotransferase
VTGRCLAADRITGWRQAAVAVPAPYLDALERAGGRPAVLRPAAAGVDEVAPLLDGAELLEGFAGLLLTGGGDVDPARYGAPPAPQVYGVDAATDEFELALVDGAIGLGLPVLAICRGLQVLNVARGGTLDQHITGRPGLEAHGQPGVAGSTHTVDVEPGTRLWAAVETSTAEASCHHHQAVARVGAGLRVSARCPDGIIEGLELDGAGWVVAVQWHPEDNAAEDPVQQRLFDAFAATCAARGSVERGSVEQGSVEQGSARRPAG